MPNGDGEGGTADVLNMLVIFFLGAIISGWFIFTVYNHLTTCGWGLFFFFNLKLWNKRQAFDFSFWGWHKGDSFSSSAGSEVLCVFVARAAGCRERPVVSGGLCVEPSVALETHLQVRCKNISSSAKVTEVGPRQVEEDSDRVWCPVITGCNPGSSSSRLAYGCLTSLPKASVSPSIRSIGVIIVSLLGLRELTGENVCKL